MKGKSSIEKVNEDMSKHDNNLLYMPVIDANNESGKKLFAEYVDKGVVPMAFEVCWNRPGEDIEYCVSMIHQMGASMIQTDRPELLLEYLRSVGRHD